LSGRDGGAEYNLDNPENDSDSEEDSSSGDDSDTISERNGDEDGNSDGASDADEEEYDNTRRPPTYDGENYFHDDDLDHQ
jgi:hypothetical protein